MAEDINENQKIARNRRGSLGENATPEQRAEERPDLRDQIPVNLKKVLEEKEIPRKVILRWDTGNANRAERLDRRKKLLQQLDEFFEPIHSVPQEWMSDLHLPTAFTICKTFHARIFQAMLGQDPPFQAKALKESNVDQAQLIEELMRFTVKRWANRGRGIDDTMDDWIWEWCTMGTAYLKMRWSKEFTRFVDVETRPVEGPGVIVDGQFVATVEEEQVAVKKDIKTFDGPLWEYVPEEDLMILGKDRDPDRADLVAHSLYMTPHELYTLADRKIFDSDLVKEIIGESGEDLKSQEVANDIKIDRTFNAGENSPDDMELTDRYHILEVYTKVAIDNSGIESDVVMWIHKKTNKLLRATYLYRVMETGERPFAYSDFYRRPESKTGIGLVELIFDLVKEIDAMHNMKIDFGLLSTNPIGFYRASSSLSKERIPLTPGELIPLEDPQRDINFPNLGNRSTFTAAEEQSLMGIVSRVTGISDIQLGVLGRQGAARTATGARAVVQESNANLDIFLRRANRGFKKALNYTFHMLKRHMPPGFEFKITGSDGEELFRRIESRTELQGSFEFEIEPNSANSNQQIQVDNAATIFQTIQNPLLLQLGIVGALELYEGAKNLFQQLQIKDWSKYLRKPDGVSRSFTPEEIGNRILSGIDVVFTPDQDINGFILWVQDFLSKDELIGQFEEQQVIALAGKLQEAQGLQAAIQQAQQQTANVQQQQLNAASSANQTAPGGTAQAGGALPENPSGGEE